MNFFISLGDIVFSCELFANAYSLSYSNNFLIALAQRNVPLVLCGKNHDPVGIPMVCKWSLHTSGENGCTDKS